MLDTVSKKHQRGAALGSRGGVRQNQSEPSISASESGNQPHESRINRIARRAHEIYEARGGEHGKALADWLQAEREIDTELTDERGIDE
jgi:hypothetical protein